MDLKDRIVMALAAGIKANLDLFGAIMSKVPEIYVAGDCTQLRFIKSSITSRAFSPIRFLQPAHSHKANHRGF